VTTYSYNSVNQLANTTNSDQNYTYDTAGNMTGSRTPDGYAFTTANYDSENRLKTIQ
jgi:YD repeat-containing protein